MSGGKSFMYCMSLIRIHAKIFGRRQRLETFICTAVSWLIGRGLLTTKYNNVVTFRKVTSTSCFEEGSIGSTCVPLCSWHRSYSLIGRRSISAAHRMRWRLAGGGGRHNYVTPQEYVSEMSTGPAGSGRTQSNWASQTPQKAATTGQC